MAVLVVAICIPLVVVWMPSITMLVVAVPIPIVTVCRYRRAVLVVLVYIPLTVVCIRCLLVVVVCRCCITMLVIVVCIAMLVVTVRRRSIALLVVIDCRSYIAILVVIFLVIVIVFVRSESREDRRGLVGVPGVVDKHGTSLGYHDGWCGCIPCKSVHIYMLDTSSRYGVE